MSQDTDFDALVANLAVEPDISEVLPFQDTSNGTVGNFEALLSAKLLPHTWAQAAATAVSESQHATENFTNLCDHFVALCWGLSHSGYVSAQAHWNSVPALYRHGTPQQKGSSLFWAIGSNGHTALGLGNGYIASSDILVQGKVSIVRETLIAQAWGGRYLGWTDAVYSGYAVGMVPTAVPPVVPPPPVVLLPVRNQVVLARVQHAAAFDRLPASGRGTYPDDVRPVCRALCYEKLLNTRYINNGSFGPPIITAYAAWQRKLGYTGKAANGIPGRVSLTKLGSRHGFTVV